ncbi:Alpha/Beta hydrolase protein [Ilyonectria destructans]|nr:Alpha/Beta hydrolase protein [Ilyonectria destructans]
MSLASYRKQKQALAKISSEWTEFSKKTPLPPPFGTPEQLRQQLKSYPKAPKLEGVSINQVTGPEREEGNQIRIYTPDVPSTNGAVIIYVHGGGWTMGSLDSEDAICQTLCKGNKVVVASVDYRKAPEHPFPTGVEDVWSSILWVTNNSPQTQIFNNIERLGGSRDRVVLGGLSAGANITAALAQRASDTEHVSFCGQILRCPMVVHPAVHPPGMDFSSYEENVNAPMLPSAAVAQFVRWYNPIPEDVRMSPLLATDFSGLPPAYVQIAGADPLRDDAFAYVEKLEQAGVPVRVSVYPGLPHGFQCLPLEATKKSDEEMIQTVKWFIKDI